MSGIDLFNRIGMAAIAFVAAHVLFYIVNGKGDHGPLLFVAFGATAGWLYTTHVARLNQIEKNTFDLIYSYNKDPRYVELREAVLRRYGPYQAITPAEAAQLAADYFSNEPFKAATKSAEFPLGYHLSHIANFYEYLAIGINSGFLSEALAKRYFSSTLRSFYIYKAGNFIAALRQRQPTGYDELLGLLVRWHPGVEIVVLEPVT